MLSLAPRHNAVYNLWIVAVYMFGVTGCTASNVQPERSDTVVKHCDNMSFTQMRVVRPTTWIATPIELYSSSASRTTINAMYGGYSFLLPRQTLPMDGSSTVFVNPATGHVWAGRAQVDFYVDTGAGILGVWQGSGGVFTWYRSLISKAENNETPQAIASRYDKLVTPGALDSSAIGFTDARSKFSPHFFQQPSGSAFSVPGTILAIRLNNNVVEINLESPGGVGRGRLCIDITTKRVVKAIEQDNDVPPATE